MESVIQYPIYTEGTAKYSEDSSDYICYVCPVDGLKLPLEQHLKDEDHLVKLHDFNRTIVKIASDIHRKIGPKPIDFGKIIDNALGHAPEESPMFLFNNFISKREDGYYCHLCALKLPLWFSVESHCNESEHQALISRKIDESIPENVLFPIIHYGLSIENSIFMKTAESRFCYLCDCDVGVSHNDVLAHINTEGHMNKRQKPIESLKTSNTCGSSEDPLVQHSEEKINEDPGQVKDNSEIDDFEIILSSSLESNDFVSISQEDDHSIDRKKTMCETLERDNDDAIDDAEMEDLILEHKTVTGNNEKLAEDDINDEVQRRIDLETIQGYQKIFLRKIEELKGGGKHLNSTQRLTELLMASESHVTDEDDKSGINPLLKDHQKHTTDKQGAPSTYSAPQSNVRVNMNYVQNKETEIYSEDNFSIEDVEITSETSQLDEDDVSELDDLISGDTNVTGSSEELEESDVTEEVDNPATSLPLEENNLNLPMGIFCFGNGFGCSACQSGKMGDLTAVQEHVKGAKHVKNTGIIKELKERDDTIKVEDPALPLQKYLNLPMGISYDGNTFTCTLCQSTKLIALQHVHEHVNGARHVKRTGGSKESKETGVTKKKKSSPRKIEYLNLPTGIRYAGKAFRCFPCLSGKMSCLSSVQQHVNGAKHIANTGGSQESKQCDVIKKVKNPAASPLKQEYLNLPMWINCVGNSFTCSACQSGKMGSLTCVQQHVKGAKHVENIELLEKYKKKPTGNLNALQNKKMEMPLVKEIQNLSVGENNMNILETVEHASGENHLENTQLPEEMIRVGKKLFRCSLCKSHMSRGDVWQHLRGLRHRTTVNRLEQLQLKTMERAEMIKDLEEKLMSCAICDNHVFSLTDGGIDGHFNGITHRNNLAKILHSSIS